MTLLPALGDWLLAFALTQLVEAPIYRRAAGASWPVALAASALTHPVVWFGFPALLEARVGYWPMVLAAELFAVGVEGLWLRHAQVAHPARWSIVANAASLCTGLALRECFGWP